MKREARLSNVAQIFFFLDGNGTIGKGRMRREAEEVQMPRFVGGTLGVDGSEGTVFGRESRGLTQTLTLAYMCRA